MGIGCGVEEFEFASVVDAVRDVLLPLRGLKAKFDAEVSTFVP